MGICSMRFSSYEHLLMVLLFTVFFYIHMIFLLVYNQREETFLALTIFSAWTLCITFFRGFESTAFFGFIFRLIIFGDMLKFTFVIFIFFSWHIQ